MPGGDCNRGQDRVSQHAPPGKASPHTEERGELVKADLPVAVRVAVGNKPRRQRRHGRVGLGQLGRGEALMLYYYSRARTVRATEYMRSVSVASSAPSLFKSYSCIGARSGKRVR